MSKIKINDFKKMSKIGEIDSFEIDGQKIEYKKSISCSEKANIVLSIITSAYNCEERNFIEISINIMLKYMILKNYITNISFPKKTFGDSKEDDAEYIVDICVSSGIYRELIDKIDDEYFDILDLLNDTKEQKLRENNLTNFLYNMLNEFKDFSPEKADEMMKSLDKIKENETFKALIK